MSVVSVCRDLSRPRLLVWVGMDWLAGWTLLYGGTYGNYGIRRQRVLAGASNDTGEPYGIALAVRKHPGTKRGIQNACMPIQ